MARCDPATFFVPLETDQAFAESGDADLKWLELSVQSPPEFVEPLSQIFYRYGHGGVALEEEGGYSPDEGELPPVPSQVTLRTYLPINSTTEERRNRIDLAVRLVAHVCPIPPLQERVLEEQEWEDSWKEHFHVLRVSPRIVIKPTWRSYEPVPGDIVISLDPGMAFGTGQHPTTRMCLERLDKVCRAGMDVLDIGCGSGILSIAAARLGARSVFALEIDSVAVGAAKQNVRENGALHNVRVGQGTLPHPEVRARIYDIAVANISAKVVSEIAKELVTAVKPGGEVIASGIVLEHSDSVVRELTAAGGRVDEPIVDGDWVTLIASVG